MPRGTPNAGPRARGRHQPAKELHDYLASVAESAAAVRATPEVKAFLGPQIQRIHTAMASLERAVTLARGLEAIVAGLKDLQTIDDAGVARRGASRADAGGPGAEGT